MDIKQTIDTRDIHPPERHARVFQAFNELQPGESIMVVDQRDPKPLYYQIGAEHPEKFTWEYLEQGPDVWRVRVGKTEKA